LIDAREDGSIEGVRRVFLERLRETGMFGKGTAICILLDEQGVASLINSDPDAGLVSVLKGDLASRFWMVIGFLN